VGSARETGKTHWRMTVGVARESGRIRSSVGIAVVTGSSTNEGQDAMVSESSVEAIIIDIVRLGPMTSRCLLRRSRVRVLDESPCWYMGSSAVALVLLVPSMHQCQCCECHFRLSSW
jgi:hypothetical protein